MRNPVAWVITKLITLYQRFISPLKKPCCRFQPTCSQYAIEAIAEWGVIRGLGLAVWRVLRCNPFGRGGADPVPINKRKRNRKLNRIKTDCSKSEHSGPDSDQTARQEAE